MSIHDVRKLGREYCQTDGSAHYKGGRVELLDLMISKDIIEDFCIGNMVKYATRFKQTRNLEDLKKVSDYSHILSGVELEKQGAEVVVMAEIRPQDEVWKCEDVCDGCRKEGDCDEPCMKWYSAQQKKVGCIRPEVTE